MINRHHVLHEKKTWQLNPLAKKLRSHAGMIIPMYVEDHQRLHRTVKPPQIPRDDLLSMTLEHLQSVERDRSLSRLDMYDSTVEYLGGISLSGISYEAGKLKDNLQAQRLFMGQVVPDLRLVVGSGNEWQSSPVLGHRDNVHRIG